MNFIKIPGKDFEMMDAPVTQKEWSEVMGNDPSCFKGANNPVEQVSWHDCQEFIKKLNEEKDGFIYDLPTEEEWEYCAKSCDKQKIKDIAWCCENSDNKTHPVKQKKPNSLGLYDMLGNVWEWTSTKEGSGRVLRGGGWYDFARVLRSGCRGSISPGIRYGDFGFRLLREEIKCTQKNMQGQCQKDSIQNLNHAKNVALQNMSIDTTMIIKNLLKLFSYVESITLKDIKKEVIGDGDLKSLRSVLSVKNFLRLQEITIKLNPVDENAFENWQALLQIKDGIQNDVSLGSITVLPLANGRIAQAVAKVQEALDELKELLK